MGEDMEEETTRLIVANEWMVLKITFTDGWQSIVLEQQNSY